MDFFQIFVLVFLGVFYAAYFAKAIMLKRHGIAVNILGKGDKPNAARIVEYILRFATLTGAGVQFGSAAFPGLVWSFPANDRVSIIGIIVVLFGNLFFIIAMLTMRDNWRAGFANNQNTNLVTQGIYSISRNPAFVGFDFIYIGCAVVFPNIVNITITLAVLILFHIQILGEEQYCSDAFGKEYADYKEKTMRYLGKRPYRLIAKLKMRAKQLKTDVPAVFLALKRKETPLPAKILAAVTVAYALSPIDLIPDFIPVVGFLDDVIILPGLIAVIVKIIPKDIFAQCRKEAENLWANGKPEKWYYAVPIVAVWLFIIALMVWNIFLSKTNLSY